MTNRKYYIVKEQQFLTERSLAILGAGILKGTQVHSIVKGEVIKYTTSWNIFSHYSYVIVSLDDNRITIVMDSRQQEHIQSEYPPGSSIPIEFYNGKWNVASKDTEERVYVPEEGVSINDMLDSLTKNQDH